MLVKFKNDSKEFEDKVEHLKRVLNVGAASKVAEFAVDNYAQLDKQYHKALDRIEILLSHIDDIRSAAAAKDTAETKINKLLKVKL